MSLELFTLIFCNGVMNFLKRFIAPFFVFFILDASAQEDSKIQTFTPSVLLNENQIDVQFFNNIYSQTGYRNDKGKFTESGRRETYYSGLVQFLYGVDKNRRFNYRISKY